MRNGKQGFTLIELLIVIAIIAILALIAIPNFLEAQTRSKVVRCKADMRSVAIALETFRVDHNQYPPHWNIAKTYFNNSQEAGDPLWNPKANSVGASLTSPIAYITSILNDPFRTSSGYGTCSYGYGVDFPDSATAWILEGVGPDRALNDPCAGGPRTDAGQNPDVCFKQIYTDTHDLQQIATFFTAGGVYKGHQFTGQYDPTNGTISAGDIVRMNFASQQ